MEILKRSDHGYAQDPTKNFGFDIYNGQGSSDSVLIVAAFDWHAGCWKQFNLSPAELERVKSKKVVRLEFEEPNKFFISEDFESYDHDFYKVFTLCPFTSKYLNEMQGAERRVPIFFPFNSMHIPPVTQKKYDIIYTGHLHPKPILRDVKLMSRFNYRLVSNSDHELVTDRGVGYEEKIKLISESRITLVHNLLYPTFAHLRSVWKYKNWKQNEAFKELPDQLSFYRFFTHKENMLVPQLKSRPFEAAFSRSLILCKKDPFNVIENFFEKDKEFIYYEEGKLEETVKKILNNYSDYQSIIENAYNRAVRDYTTETFFQKYLKTI
jgi:hypothetical protein